MKKMLTAATVPALLCCTVVQADVTLQPQKIEANVLRPAWESLRDEERDQVRAAYIVVVSDPSDFGLIVDAQGVDRSIPGSTAGSDVGGAVAEVGYLSHALKHGNSYSPGKHLAFGLLGVLIGSAANAAPVSQYQFRYALKMSDGETVTKNVMQNDPFRHSIGMCMNMTSISPAPKAMCGQTADDIRAKYVNSATALGNQKKSPDGVGLVAIEPASGIEADKVSCKTRNQAPVLVKRETCEMLGGTVI